MNLFSSSSFGVGGRLLFELCMGTGGWRGGGGGERGNGLKQEGEVLVKS